MAHLAAVILTCNEAHHIQACVESLRNGVDAVIVWDSGSTDDTVARAQEAGALVVQLSLIHISTDEFDDADFDTPA